MPPKSNPHIEAVLMSMRYMQPQMATQSERDELLRIISVLEKAKEVHAQELDAIRRGGAPCRDRRLPGDVDVRSDHAGWLRCIPAE